MQNCYICRSFEWKFIPGDHDNNMLDETECEYCKCKLYYCQFCDRKRTGFDICKNCDILVKENQHSFCPSCERTVDVLHFPKLRNQCSVCQNVSCTSCEVKENFQCPHCSEYFCNFCSYWDGPLQKCLYC